MKKGIIEIIRQKIGDPKVRCTFGQGAGEDEIKKLEKEIKAVFPDSFRHFLLHFNGGFISLYQHEKKLDPETDAWNSNYFLSLPEISQAFNRIEYKLNIGGPRFIPFMHTRDQEYLAFRWPQAEGKKESKVYDIWHEAFPGEWEEQVVYESFTELMEDYLEYNGDITTM